MASVTAFYDHYHRQNDYFSKVIGANNFTYFYIFETLRQACLVGQLTGKRVLDVGCGVGTLSLWCATQGAKVTGLDISPRAIKIAQHAADQLKLKNIAFEVGELKKGVGKFDIILCSEVIEHVPDPDKLARYMFSHLRPGGVLILGTPSRQNLLFKLGYYRNFDQAVGHLRRYTVAEIEQELSRQGFEIQSVRAVEGPLRNILFTSPLGILIKGIKGPLVPVFHWFDRVSAAVFGAADIHVIAVKPS